MHIVVYESYNGKIPKNHHIHHMDGNRSNNSIENLKLMSTREHLSLHSSKPENVERARKHAEKIRPLTKAWHASKEGLEWHRNHGIQGWENRDTFEMVCHHCGIRYITKVYHQIFCSNKCKSSARRACGIDNIEVDCEYCGKKFIKSKYSKSFACSIKCGAKVSWIKGKRNKKNR
jgi:hypothetical protein